MSQPFVKEVQELDNKVMSTEDLIDLLISAPLVQGREDFWERMLAAGDESYMVSLIARTSERIDLVKTYAASTSKVERNGAAKNPHAPSDVLRALAADDSTLVRSSVAGNPGTPLETLRILEADGNGTVSATARRLLTAHRLASPREI